MSFDGKAGRVALIDPRSLELFYWVVQLGGFRRAAEKMATTQPAVSARIAGLELAVGARLLERGQRRTLNLTPQGMLLLGYAERWLALQAEMQAVFAGPAGLQGTVRLGVAETLVHTWFSSLVRRLHAAHPLVQLDIMVDISVDLRAALLAGEIDVALLLGPVMAPGVQDLALSEYALGWVAAPGLDLASEPLDLDGLRRVPIVTYARETVPYQQVRALFTGHPAPRIFANSSLASIVRMVLDGIGVGVIATSAIRAELDSGALRLLAVTPILAPLRFTASWRDGPGSALAATVARMAAAVAVDHPA
jgi:DNA-binding transcriptional LysR family regulator